MVSKRLEVQRLARERTRKVGDGDAQFFAPWYFDCAENYFNA